MADKKDTTVVLTAKEKYNPLFWQDGVAGPANIVTYNGEDCRGVSFVADDQARKLIIDQHNLAVRLLFDHLERDHFLSVQQKLSAAAMHSGTPEAALELAQRFHDTYERLAPQFGYETRQDTKQFDPNSPNGQLMRAVAKEILKDYLPLGES